VNMAFVNSSFLGVRGTKLAQSTCASPVEHQFSLPCASAKGFDGKGFVFPPEDGGDARERFEPFDGSMPLLPPWRPPTVEADFAFNAKRLISRESGLQARKENKIVKVESKGGGTLFAEVVQETVVANDRDGSGNRQPKMWLRPLLLNSEVENTFMDLRGGTDLVLEASKVSEIDSETRTRVTVNLAATEADALDRAVSDERWNESGSKALLVFMRSLSEG